MCKTLIAAAITTVLGVTTLSLRTSAVDEFRYNRDKQECGVPPAVKVTSALR